MKDLVERIESLPMWAKLHLKRQSRRIDDLKNEITALEMHPNEAATGLLQFQNGLTPENALKWIDLPDKATIRFKNGEHRISIRVDKLEPLKLEVYCTGGSLVVEPKVQNVVLVSIKNES